MNAYKHIALIAAVTLFASCTKNEVVEPATDLPGTDAAVENPVTETTPLLGSDAQPESSASHTTPLLDSDAQPHSTASHTTPLLDSDTPPAVTTTNAPDANGMDIESVRTAAGKKPYIHNMEAE